MLGCVRVSLPDPRLRFVIPGSGRQIVVSSACATRGTPREGSGTTVACLPRIRAFPAAGAVGIIEKEKVNRDKDSVGAL